MTPEEIEEALEEICRQMELGGTGNGPLVVTIPGTNKAYFNTI